MDTIPVLRLIKSANNLTCSTTNLSLTASGGTTYLWNDGNANAVRSVTAAGTYSVTATNDFGCQTAQSIDIQADTTRPTVNITPSVSTLNCFFPTSTLRASGGVTYLWSTGATTAAISVNQAATYSVTATAANGCTQSISETINRNATRPTASVATNRDSLTCSQPTTLLTAIGGVTYKWLTNNSTNATLSVSLSGLYSIVAFGANGCTDTANIQVRDVKTLPTALISSSNDTLTCNRASVNLTASGGNAYAWNNDATSATITVTTAGTYTVTHPQSGCTATASKTVIDNNTLPVTLTSNPVNNLLTCANNNVVLTANATTGSTFFWNTAETTPSVSTASTGNFSVTVTGTNGCTAIRTLSVGIDTTRPTALITGNNYVCTGSSTNLTASGGSTYLWSTGSTSQAINVNPSISSLYTVTVTGANGCTKTDTQFINVLQIVAPSLVSNRQPANSSINLPSTVEFSWSAAASDFYVYVLTDVNDNVHEWGGSVAADYNVNNVRRSASKVKIKLGAFADLITSAVSVDKTAVNADSSFTANIQFKNIGNANTTQGFDYAVTVKDSATGSNPDNNAANDTQIIPLSITRSPYADLTITAFTTASEAYAGQNIKIYYTVRNNGTGNLNGKLYTGLWLSPSPSSSGQMLATGLFDGTLNVGSSHSDSMIVALPSAVSGGYYLYMFTDNNNSWYEYTFEGNNDAVRTINILPTTQSAADLIVKDVAATTPSVKLGERDTFTFKVVNMGTAPTSGANRQAVYLSTDATFSSNDRLIGSETQGNFFLNAGDSTTVGLSSVMQDQEGNFYPIARTNLQASVSESNVENNTKVAVSTIAVSTKILPLSILDATTLNIEQPRYYRVAVDSGKDLLVCQFPQKTYQTGLIPSK